MYLPRGIALDPAGSVYIADTSNHRIREAQAVPVISQNAVVNAASFAPQLAPGALATVFGQHFATASVGGAPPLSTALAGVSVNLNGQPVPLLYVTPFQANFQVPWGTAAGDAKITVTSNGLTSASSTVPVLTAAPGLFVTAAGRAVAQNAGDNSLNSTSAPAKTGSTIVAYLTGAGPVDQKIPDGGATPNSIVNVTSAYSATIGSATAQVSFAGMTPGFIGLAQMNIIVPASLTTGDYPLTVIVNGQASNSAPVSVSK
jgi:adhesin/invasin